MLDRRVFRVFLVLGGLMFAGILYFFGNSISTYFSRPETVVKKVTWGAYVGWETGAMSEFESLLGKAPQMEMVFVHWGNEAFPFEYTPRIKDQGRTMVIFWEALDYTREDEPQPEYSFDAVLSGKLDRYFRTFASDAKTYGGPIILIPYSEMNGDWYPWSTVREGNTPEKYIQAYQYIHKHFTDVPNVKFGFVVNNETIPNTPENQFERAYPGDMYVDVVGVDGFAGYETETWKTFDELFRDILTRLSVYQKPIYIFSFAAAEDPRKAQWITDALSVQIPAWPEIEGFLWFNENKERDWRVNSNPDALRAFRDGFP